MPERSKICKDLGLSTVCRPNAIGYSAAPGHLRFREAKAIHSHRAYSRFHHAQSPCRGPREIDDPAFGKWPAIIYPHFHRFPSPTVTPTVPDRVRAIGEEG
jgi:hypothetical protein